MLVSNLYGDGIDQFNWEVQPDDSFLKRVTRVEVVNLACGLKIEECTEMACSYFHEWIHAGNQVHPDLRKLMYKYGVMDCAGEDEWNQTWDYLMDSVDPQENLILMQALAYSQDPALLKGYLELSEDPSKIKVQDYFLVYGFISSNPVGEQVVWDYYRDNYDKLVERFTLSSQYLGSVITKITNNFSSRERLEELEQFFADYPVHGSAKKDREKAHERVLHNIMWLENYEDKIADWLDGVVPKKYDFSDVKE